MVLHLGTAFFVVKKDRSLRIDPGDPAVSHIQIVQICGSVLNRSQSFHCFGCKLCLLFQLVHLIVREILIEDSHNQHQRRKQDRRRHKADGLKNPFCHA